MLSLFLAIQVLNLIGLRGQDPSKTDHNSLPLSLPVTLVHQIGGSPQNFLFDSNKPEPIAIEGSHFSHWLEGQNHFSQLSRFPQFTLSADSAVGTPLTTTSSQIKITDRQDTYITFSLPQGINTSQGVLEILYGTNLDQLKHSPYKIARIPITQIADDKVKLSRSAESGFDPYLQTGFFQARIVPFHEEDTSAPIIEVTSPGLDTTGTEETVTFRGRVKSKNAIVSIKVTATLLVDGYHLVNFQPSGPDSVEWEVNVPLQMGANLIVIEVQDTRGKTTQNIIRTRIQAMPNPGTVIVDFGGKLSMTEGIHLIKVRPGVFSQGDFGNVPHQVTLTKEFWLGESEVTQTQWQALMGNNPSWFQESGNLPVEQLSWYDCMEFCARLTQLERLAARLPEHHVYTLPTESQWEYACRELGKPIDFLDPEDLDSAHANVKGSWKDYKLLPGIFREKTLPVKSFSPNALGFFDMHGNVSEWCIDWYGEHATETPTGWTGYPAWDPVGPNQGEYRVSRGGGWNSTANLAIVTVRGFYSPKVSSNKSQGFRLSRQSNPLQSGDFPVNPKILLFGSFDDTETTEEFVTFRGVVRDLTGIKKFQANGKVLNEVHSIEHGWVNWEVTLPMELGRNKIEFQAEDKYGNSSKLDILYWRINENPTDRSRVVDNGGLLSFKDAIRLIWVKPGNFMMGSPPTEPGRESFETQHPVTLTQEFWLGETEVTQAQWKSIMGYNNSHFKDDDRLPVDNVSHSECMNFCAKLTQLEHDAGRLPKNMYFTLPTEAQWEYACRERGQAFQAFHYGDSLDPNLANIPGNENSPSLNKAVVVKSYKPNALGFYDMHGNVAEYVLDLRLDRLIYPSIDYFPEVNIWFDNSRRYAKWRIDPFNGNTRSQYFCSRGGSWKYNSARSAARTWILGGFLGGDEDIGQGFRLSLKIDPNKS